MATVSDTIKILQVLEENGLADSSLESDHDVIYLPVSDEDVPYAEELIALGAFYSEEFDCWTLFT